MFEQQHGNSEKCISIALKKMANRGPFSFRQSLGKPTQRQAQNLLHFFRSDTLISVKSSRFRFSDLHPLMVFRLKMIKRRARFQNKF